MRSNLPDTAARDDVVTVEAPTAEEALRLITRRLGSAAEIVEARREPRGGIAGFFAREMVVMRARAGDDPGTATDVPPASTAAPAAPSVGPNPPDAAPRQRAEPGDPASVADAFDALIARAEEAEALETDFDTLLRRRLASDDTSGVAGPSVGGRVDTGELHGSSITAAPAAVHRSSAGPVPAPATTADGANGGRRYPGAVRWDRRRLLRDGFSPDLLAACAGLDPTDDVGWVTRIATLVEPLCGPLPAGGLLVGRRADRLAAALGLDPSAFCVVRDAAEEARIGPALAGRGLHLVLDGIEGNLGLVDDPVVVSWVGDDAAARAVAVARALGITLGYGMGSELGADPFRVTPLDVAYAIRRTMERDR